MNKTKKQFSAYHRNSKIRHIRNSIAYLKNFSKVKGVEDLSKEEHSDLLEILDKITSNLNKAKMVRVMCEPCGDKDKTRYRMKKYKKHNHYQCGECKTFAYSSEKLHKYKLKEPK